MRVSVDKILTSLIHETSLRNVDAQIAVEELLRERALLVTALTHRSYLDGVSLRPYMEITVLGTFNSKPNLMGQFENPMTNKPVQLPLV